MKTTEDSMMFKMAKKGLPSSLPGVQYPLPEADGCESSVPKPHLPSMTLDLYIRAADILMDITSDLSNRNITG